MRFGTAKIEDRERLVALMDETHVVDLARAYGRVSRQPVSMDAFGSMQSFLEAGEAALAAAREVVEGLGGAGDPAVYPLEKVQLLSPIPRPAKNIMCVGRNYREHVAESRQLSGKAAEIPAHPLIFTKPYTSVIGPDAPITFSRSVTEKVDYEGEVVVVIGRAGRDIPPDQAMDHVFGYALMNDVSARDLQFRHVQYFKGKSLDTFGPLGPWIVDKAAVPDYRALHLETRVNGELRQSAMLKDLIFDVPTLISVLSAGMTLHPGDLIATGTPSGVGGGFDPQRFLRNGDVVEISVVEIGTLRNPVREL